MSQILFWSHSLTLNILSPSVAFILLYIKGIHFPFLSSKDILTLVTPLLMNRQDECIQHSVKGIYEVLSCSQSSDGTASEDSFSSGSKVTGRILFSASKVTKNKKIVVVVVVILK